MSSRQELRYFQVDVFTSAPFGGNPLVVFPWARDLTKGQMQTIAGEVNFSETTFVTEFSDEAYSVRIFTPGSELPFAGHPTVGTAWVLGYLGLIQSATPVQTSVAGRTPLERSGGVITFARGGSSQTDVQDELIDRVAEAVGLDRDDLGVTDPEGRVRLNPASSDAGLPCLVVPVKDRDALARARPTQALTDGFEEPGAYVFTFDGEDVLSRGFLPATGVPEDPATGSFAAALGAYLRDRLGPVALKVIQGVQMGRPSQIELRAGSDDIYIGGTAALVATGSLESFPSATPTP